MSSDLSGKRVLVTGANAGIGFAMARALADMGASILVHGRDDARVEEAVAALRAGAKTDIRGLVADFRSLDAVGRLAREVAADGPLDVLVNNAGLMRDRPGLTDDGLDEVFQVNHLAVFALTLKLWSALQAASAARVVTVASGAHGMVNDLALDELARPSKYRPLDVYARSKACNIFFTSELARRAEGHGITVQSFHPGLVASRFARDGDVRGWLRVLIPLFRPFSRTPQHGADTGVWLASVEPAAAPDGGYFKDRRQLTPEPYARDNETAEELWSLSERLTGVRWEDVVHA